MGGGRGREEGGGGGGAFLLTGSQEEGEGGGREGGTALDLSLMCEDVRLNPPESSSLIMKNCGRAAPIAPFHRGRGCRGLLDTRNSFRCCGRGPDAGSPFLTPWLSTPPPGSLVDIARSLHS